MNPHPKVILVDEHDHPIGTADKLEAHQKGMLHRAFSIMLIDPNSPFDDPLLLLQQRHPEKYHSGNKWTNTCCSHPQPGEQVITSAQTRLAYEMGLQAKLEPIGSCIYRACFDNGLIEHEYDHILIGHWEGKPPQYHRQEAIDHRWQSLSCLKKDIATNPTTYSIWLPQVVNTNSKHNKQTQHTD